MAGGERERSGRRDGRQEAGRPTSRRGGSRRTEGGRSRACREKKRTRNRGGEFRRREECSSEVMSKVLIVKEILREPSRKSLQRKKA